MESIVLYILGVFCIVMGGVTFSGNLLFVKKRNKINIREYDRLPFGRLCGIAYAILGVGCIVLGIIIHIFGTESIVALAVIPFAVVATILTVIAAFKYNRK